MSEAVIVAIITGGISLIGTIITVIVSSSKTNNEMRVTQAVTDTKLENLATEVKIHNEFAMEINRKLPVIEEQIKVANHRIDDLEKAQDKK